MFNKKNSTNLLSLVTLVFCIAILLTANIFSMPAKKLNYSYKALNNMVSEKLKYKLQEDLFEEDLIVKIKTINGNQNSDDRFEMKGEAIYMFPKSNIKVPIRYEAQISLREREVKELNYDFVETKSEYEYAPTNIENVIMDSLLKKVSAEYKTEDVVMALDDEKNSIISEDQKTYKGFGYIQINNKEWKKVQFTIELSLSGKDARKVFYKLQ